MNTRIGIRVPQELRTRMNQAVGQGRFKNISELVKVAVEKLLTQERELKK